MDASTRVVEFGEYLGDLLASRGVTPQAFADLLFVDPSYVYRWLRGERIPSIDNNVFRRVLPVLHLSDVEYELLCKAQKHSWLLQALMSKYGWERPRAERASTSFWQSDPRRRRLASTADHLPMGAEAGDWEPGTTFAEFTAVNTTKQRITGVIFEIHNGVYLHNESFSIAAGLSKTVRTPPRGIDGTMVYVRLDYDVPQHFTSYQVSERGVPIAIFGGQGFKSFRSPHGIYARLKTNLPLVVRSYHGFEAGIEIVNMSDAVSAAGQLDIFAPQRLSFGPLRRKIATMEFDSIAPLGNKFSICSIKPGTGVRLGGAGCQVAEKRARV